MQEALISLSWILAVLVCLPLLVFSSEVLLGLKSVRREVLDCEAPSICVLIPAHNEGQIIKGTLERLQLILPTRAAILVVADNCSDDTAAIVQQLGIPVIERSDTTRRGKGFALAFGRDWLSNDPPDCVLVFDADCTSDAQSLDDLSRLSVDRARAMQAGYAFEPDRSAAAKVQISNFAIWVKNVIRQRGSYRLGGSAILTGTGMAFPWQLFVQLPLATASIVEDLSLTIELAKRGMAPCYLDQATVSSVSASEVATLEQRSRWEHGFLAVARGHGIPTLIRGLKGLDSKSIFLGLHLLVPPLALLLTVALVSAVILAGTGALTGYWLPFVATLVFIALSSTSVILAWVSGGHKWLKAQSMLLVPIYLFWKIPVYLRYALGQTATWVRTDRNNHP